MMNANPGQQMTIRARDFIHGPYVPCLSCGAADAFGVLSIHGTRYVRRCRECLAMSESLPLPLISKKLVYLDQNAISNMMKALNPETKAHRKGSVDPFWKDLFESLDSLCKLQLIVCPDSHSHLDESLLSEFYQSLKRMFENLSGGVTFYDRETIQCFQIHRQLEKWLGDELRALTAQNITQGEINVWQDVIRISTNLDWSSFVPDIRATRDAIAEAMVPIFERWQSEPDRRFEDWYEEEWRGQASALIELERRTQRRMMLAAIGQGGVDLGDISNHGVMTLFDIRRELRHRGCGEGELQEQILAFLGSSEFEATPSVRIGAMMYAAVARQAAHGGRKKPPTRGFSTDVSVISSLLPYCDAIFVDNDCRNILSENPLRDRINYGTAVFSMSNKDEFLKYLAESRKEATADHMSAVREVYGQNCGIPYTGIYRKGPRG